MLVLVGRGFTPYVPFFPKISLDKMQVHDNLGFKFRSSHYNSAGTVKGDKLCMDASETRVVVSVIRTAKLDS